MDKCFSGNCVNFDECSLKGTYCVGGTCIDTDGSYTCICPEVTIFRKQISLSNYRWHNGNPFISKILDHFKGQEENNGICQTPDHMMAIVDNQVQVTDFDEPSSCFITESCDNKYKLRKLIMNKKSSAIFKKIACDTKTRLRHKKSSEIFYLADFFQEHAIYFTERTE